MWCNWFLNISPLQLMTKRGNSSLTNPVYSTICRWSTTTRMTGTALKNACIHSSFLSCPFLPSLGIEANAQSKAVTNVSFWVVNNHGMKTEDVGDRRKKWFLNSTGWTSPRSLFLMLDGNDRVSQVSSTITDFIWRPNYKQHHDAQSLSENSKCSSWSS